MSDYIKDPNNSNSQVPGKLPDNAYDRHVVVASASFHKTPNYVYFNEAPAKPVHFFFGSSASFAENSISANNMTGSEHYISYGKPAVGTILDIHPTAWSGSSGDQGKIIFVYTSGLSTGRR
tara:strand:- start:157 stop:519 length:363 start_codon:yes stop_codon:yes gene_type:complete